MSLPELCSRSPDQRKLYVLALFWSPQPAEGNIRLFICYMLLNDHQLVSGCICVCLL